jgi:hypothetical protein
MIIVMNILVIIGYGITMYDNMYVIAAGRFVLGFGSGGFSVYCPKFSKFCFLREIFLTFWFSF